MFMDKQIKNENPVFNKLLVEVVVRKVVERVVKFSRIVVVDCWVTELTTFVLLEVP